MAAPTASRRRTTWLVRGGVLVALALLFWLVPPFHVVRLKAAAREHGPGRQQTTGVAFDASAFVEKLWGDSLVNSSARATNAAILLAEIQKDAKAAREKYGRGSELSTGYFYFIAGEGRVTAVNPDGISLSIATGDADSGETGVGAAGASGTDTRGADVTGAGARPDVVLETGNIFGNAVRDGTGLVDVSRFANSQDFNAVSSEINRRVEERVLPPLRAKASVGATVRFVGCAEVVSEASDLRPLRVVPVIAAVLP